MARRSRKGNPELLRVLVELRRAARNHHAPVWESVAERLERSRHALVPLNVGQLERLAAADETIAVAGKLLSEGPLSKRLTVGAFSYSAQARAKVRAAGGSALSLHDLLKAKPDGKGVRFLA